MDEYIDLTVSDHNNYSYTSYNWIVSGDTIISGQGEKEITVLVGSNPGTHFNKWVRAENTYGVGDYYGEYGYIEDCGGGEFKEFPFRINTSNLPDGLYIINIIYEGKIFSMQVMIEH